MEAADVFAVADAIPGGWQMSDTIRFRTAGLTITDSALICGCGTVIPLNQIASVSAYKESEFLSNFIAWLSIAIGAGAVVFGFCEFISWKQATHPNVAESARAGIICSIPVALIGLVFGVAILRHKYESVYFVRVATTAGQLFDFQAKGYAAFHKIHVAISDALTAIGRPININVLAVGALPSRLNHQG